MFWSYIRPNTWSMTHTINTYQVDDCISTNNDFGGNCSRSILDLTHNPK